MAHVVTIWSKDNEPLAQFNTAETPEGEKVTLEIPSGGGYMTAVEQLKLLG
jgi:hypothetical protein